MRNIDGLEDENEYKILIQSMPVSRLEVVVSKIIFHLLQVGINLFVIVLLNGLLPNLKANSPREIFLTTILAIILILGYQFLYTFFGPVFMNYITVIFFLLFMLFGWTIARSSFIKGVIEWVLSIDQTILFIMLSLICLVLSTLILFVTLKVYEHKDFN